MRNLKSRISIHSPGLTFVVTGALQKYTRQEIQNLIRDHGGKASGSVSQKTDYLIAGENAGSKLEKANQLEIKVISEPRIHGNAGLKASVISKSAPKC